MLVPKRLKIRGFRGFRDQVEFRLDKPVVLLSGDNHSGKSSTLNAIEWCLFGDECTGKQTGIRERIGWIVPNRHMDAPDVQVVLELTGPEGCYVVDRAWTRSGRRAARMELRLSLPTGEILVDAQAEQRLAQLIGATFRDFLTTVYQHQEAIRAVLTQEPRERNDAIDRLLGLSIYRNLLDAVGRVKAADRQKSVRQQFEGFEREVQAALSARENDLQELRREAADAGIPPSHQNEKIALALAGAIKASLDALAGEAGIAQRPLALPARQADLALFEANVRTTITWMRSEMPSVKEQAALFRRQKSALEMEADVESAAGRCDEVQRGLQKLDRETGGRQAVTNALKVVGQGLASAHDRLRVANGRAAVAREALHYLEQAATGDLQDRCPVCEQPAADLLGRLHEQWENRLLSHVADIETEINTLCGRKQELQAALTSYERLAEKETTALQQLAECRRRIGELTGKRLGAEDDLTAILKGELAALEARGNEIGKAIEEKEKCFAAAEVEIAKVRVLREILNREEKRQILEKIQESPTYQEATRLRDELADWATDLQSIEEALLDGAKTEAQEKLQGAEITIDDYFRRMARHPAVRRICLKVSDRHHRNDYDITDEEGRDLTPILSQGDLNALALAIFLGLATTSADAGTFGFVLLDDPSQSLGAEHKKHLVQVLDEVARKKNIVVATMDTEFRSLVLKDVTKAKTEYTYASWTPARGPLVTNGEMK